MAVLADAIISAVGAEHVDKIGEFTPPLSDCDFPPSLSPSTATAFNSDALWFWTLHAHWCGVPSLAQSCPLLPMTPALSLPTP